MKYSCAEAATHYLHCIAEKYMPIWKLLCMLHNVVRLIQIIFFLRCYITFRTQGLYPRAYHFTPILSTYLYTHSRILGHESLMKSAPPFWLVTIVVFHCLQYCSWNPITEFLITPDPQFTSIRFVIHVFQRYEQNNFLAILYIQTKN